MEDAEHEARLAQLTAEMDWLRLARALLRSHDSEDVVHETWLAASKRIPDDRPLRPWLSRVLRNVSRTRARGRLRREARDTADATIDQAPPTPEDLVQRVELHRLVSDEVLRLKEPYRSTILLHYFEELSSAAIARRLKLPEGTVRRRLKVGLDELRSRLDQKERNPGGLRALAPLAAMRATPTSPALAGVGSIVMKKIVIAVVLLVLAGLVTLSVRRLAQGSSAEQRATRIAKTKQATLVGVPRPHVASGGDPLAWFADRNAPSRKIAGRVTFRGAPVKDAEVELHSAVSRAHAAAPISLRTDASGRFDFGYRAPTQYFVTASSANTTAAIVDLPLADPTSKPPSDQLELRLGECSDLVEGKIYDASENPLPRMHVRRHGSFGGGLIGVETDDVGHYTLCVPHGEVAVEYGGEGFGTVRLTVDVRGEMHRDVVLVPEATIKVRVVRADDGAPVADAYVIVGPLGSGPGPDRPAQMNAVTDKGGEVQISGLVPGRIGVFARADGGLQSQPVVEALAQVGVETEVIVKMGGTARITGKVLDGTAPVAGAQVQAIHKLPGGGAIGGGTGFSQPDGSFVLDHVPPGDVELSAKPFELDTATTMTVEAGKSYDGLVLQVQPSASIRGRVTRFGKPVVGANVCCVVSVSPSSVVTDDEGKYEFIGVAPDKYAIAAISDAIGAGTFPKTVTIKAGEQRTLDFELDIAGTIAGLVVDRDGKPVEGAFVRWLQDETGDTGQCIADARGRYRCGAMTGGGKYRPTVFPSSNVTEPYPAARAPYAEVNVKDGTTVVEGVTLVIDRPRRAISGRVVDESGGPIGDATVKALALPDGRPAVFSSWQRLPSTSTAVDGSFSIPDLGEAHYALQARAADGSEGVASSVNGGTDNVTIRIERAGSIEGKLAKFKDTPAVIVRPLGESSVIPGTVDGMTFRVAGLRPGRYLVTAQSLSEGDTRIIDVRAGQITSIEMTSRGHATIEGTVFDFRTHAGISNASCHAVLAVDGNPVVPNWDVSGAAKTDASGHFTIASAPAGSVTVMCRTAGLTWTPSAADVTVATGGHAVVQLPCVANTSENASTIGVEFDWNVTAPRIASVLGNGPAAIAGIATGDLVTHVNGVPVGALNGAGVQRLIESVAVGDEVRITAQRGAATNTFSVRTAASL